MSEVHIHLHLRLPRPGGWARHGGLAAAVILIAATHLGSESLTMTMTYPSPSGIYAQLITTGAPDRDTLLNRDGGDTILAPESNLSGRVGIGTSAPTAKLHVQGSLRIVDGSQAAGRVLTAGDDGTAAWRPPAGFAQTNCVWTDFSTCGAYDSQSKGTATCPEGKFVAGVQTEGCQGLTLQNQWCSDSSRCKHTRAYCCGGQ